MFDMKKCDRLIEALRQYRKAWDEKNRRFQDHPHHDWASHAADAGRYGAVTRDPATEARPRVPVFETHDAAMGMLG
jgi:hypothetical protein